MDGSFAKVQKASKIRECLSLDAARHAFISRKLAEGWAIAKVARACGTSTKEIERVYDKNFGNFNLIAEVMA